jgi:hypothetical protein
VEKVRLPHSRLGTLGEKFNRKQTGKWDWDGFTQVSSAKSIWV